MLQAPSLTCRAGADRPYWTQRGNSIRDLFGSYEIVRKIIADLRFSNATISDTDIEILF